MSAVPVENNFMLLAGFMGRSASIAVMVSPVSAFFRTIEYVPLGSPDFRAASCTAAEMLARGA